MAAKWGRLSVIALAFVHVGAHAKKPSDYQFGPDATTALVIMKADWWQPAPSMNSAYELSLSAYDPVDQKLLGGLFSGGGRFEAKKTQFIDGYLFTSVKPGRWVVASYSQQYKWTLCFNAASLQFDVKPGEVLYLGAFDAQAHRRQLTEQVMRSGKVLIQNSDFADFFDLPNGPSFAPVDEGQLDAVRAMLGQRAPGITASVRRAEFSPAVFGTGSTLFAQRRCGGYFKKGATDPKK